MRCGGAKTLGGHAGTPLARQSPGSAPPRRGIRARRQAARRYAATGRRLRRAPDGFPARASGEQGRLGPDTAGWVYYSRSKSTRPRIGQSAGFELRPPTAIRQPKRTNVLAGLTRDLEPGWSRSADLGALPGRSMNPRSPANRGSGASRARTDDLLHAIQLRGLAVAAILQRLQAKTVQGSAPISADLRSRVHPECIAERVWPPHTFVVKPC
jgi:hypothetical protein